MSTFADELIQSLNEALAHAKGEGPAIVHAPARGDPAPLRRGRGYRGMRSRQWPSESG